jgi:hypothetical protein
MARIPLAVQIAEIEREISLRRRVYPRWIASGRMKEHDADRHIATLEAVLATLNCLEREQKVIRGALMWAKDPTGRHWLETYTEDQPDTGDRP